MSLLEWKTFNFFKLEVIENGKYERISSIVTAHCGNTSYKIFCTARGAICIFLEDWECIVCPTTNNPIIACSITEEGDTLVVIEQSTAECLLKCYSVQKLLDRKQVNPLCCTSISKNVALQLCCHLVDSQVWIAVGLERGNIMLFKASLSRNVLNLFTTLQACLSPNKGIAFVRRAAGDIRLCVCADVGVFYYNLSSENSNETKQVIDDDYKIANCCTLMPAIGKSSEPYFVVGKEDALYCYTSEGRGPCFPISGTKQFIKYCSKHIYVVLKVPESTGSEQCSEFKSHLIIINIENNMIVCNEVLSQVLCIFPAQFQSKSLIFLRDGTIYTLRDQGIGYKLQLLYEKNQYDIALKLVEEQNVHPSIVAEVYGRYADYLMQRGDVAASVDMYIRTVGYISPFRVISRLLNIRNNDYIKRYLEVLIDSGHAYSECRSLHQNCCRRLDLPTTINQIFNKLSDNSSAGNGTLNQAYKTNKLVHLLKVKNGIVDMDISPPYEHWLVTNWPLNPGEVLKDLISHTDVQNMAFRDKLIQVFLSLLYPNKDCVLDVISSIYSEQKPSAVVNLIWAEILIQMWKSKSVDDNCVLAFFRNQKLEMNEDVQIICHTHKFWPGIKMVHDGHEMDALAMPWAHACAICPLTGSDIGASSKNVSHQMLMQTLRKEYLNSKHSSAMFQQVVSNIFHHNPHNMLTVLQRVANSAPFNVCHINSVLSKEVIVKRLSLQGYDDIPKLERKLKQLKSLLKGYFESPIEFRNSTCDACKQSLKQPSIYFSCQHAYHRECVVSYSEFNSCLVCKNNALKPVPNNASSLRYISGKLTLALSGGDLNLAPSKSKPNTYKNTNEDTVVARERLPAVSKNPFEEVAEIDSSNMFKAISSSKASINSNAVARDKRPRVQSSNPFEDPNSNPFM